MASWSARRKSLFLSLGALALIIFVGVPLFFYFYKAPTCFDGKQNGPEEGIDCGGACSKVCSFQAAAPIVLWSRSFPVAPGVWSAVALIENPNTGIDAPSVPYAFRVLDSKNVLIYERKGVAYIPPKGVFPIFESGIVTGERVPQKTLFAFSGDPVWEKTNANGAEIKIGERLLTNELTLPRLTASLENTSLDGIADIAVVAVLYDAEDNALGVSRTTLAFLEAESKRSIVFTWPQAFSASVARIELYTLVSPPR